MAARSTTTHRARLQREDLECQLDAGLPQQRRLRQAGGTGFEGGAASPRQSQCGTLRGLALASFSLPSNCFRVVVFVVVGCLFRVW